MWRCIFPDMPDVAVQHPHRLLVVSSPEAPAVAVDPPKDAEPLASYTRWAIDEQKKLAYYRRVT